MLIVQIRNKNIILEVQWKKWNWNYIIIDYYFASQVTLNIIKDDTNIVKLTKKMTNRWVSSSKVWKYKTHEIQVDANIKGQWEKR